MVNRQVRRLQVRIVKVARRENRRDTGFAHAGLRIDLSRVMICSQFCYVA